MEGDSPGGFQHSTDTFNIEIDSRWPNSLTKKGRKSLNWKAMIFTGKTIGTFDLDDVSTSLTGLTCRYYPRWSGRLKIQFPASTLP
jgi:hypothetical protein